MTRLSPGRIARRPQALPSGEAEEAAMNHTYAVTELVGSSAKSIEDAIETALATARGTLRNLDWFEVTQLRGHLKPDGSVAHYQVGIKLGFRYDTKP